MLLLRRVFLDGPDRPDIVLLHYTVRGGPGPGEILARATVVVPPGRREGARETDLFLPEPPPGETFVLEYFFSTIRHGLEWYSPSYAISLPGPEAGEDLRRVPERNGGNARPAPGLGFFRLPLPLRGDVPAEGTVSFGFGAIRKKPGPDLCRAEIPLEGNETPLIEAPQALAVLKGRPMPYFLHHLAGGGAGLVTDKVTSARITWRDEAGEAVGAMLLWADPAWRAQNLSVMELVRSFPSVCPAGDYFFAENRQEWLAARAEFLSKTPPPRTFEAYVYGLSGRIVEYCFLLMRRGPEGVCRLEWKNREGGNFAIVL